MDEVGFVIKCKNCGADVKFSSGQFRRYCPVCGSSITAVIKSEPTAEEQKEIAKHKLQDLKCWICMDRGVVIYHAQLNDMSYEYAASCICSAGAGYSSLPRIDKCEMAPDLRSIIAQNKMQYAKGYGIAVK
jgi:predicted RNA-binding Zn-ribbon protein involved in translation (DUF1610 family)